MKPKAILINTCRGEVVDEPALHRGTPERAHSGALVSIPRPGSRPIPRIRCLTLPNVTLTPHSAGPTVDSFPKRFRNGYANIQRVANGQPPLWVIPEMRDSFP